MQWCFFMWHFAIIYFDTLIVLHLILAVNKLALKCVVS